MNSIVRMASTNTVRGKVRVNVRDVGDTVLGLGQDLGVGFLDDGGIRQ